MNRYKIKSILLAIVALGVMLTFGQGFAQPHAVLGAYGGSNNYIIWNTTPQRYMGYRGSYYSPWYITWNYSTKAPENIELKQPAPDQSEPSPIEPTPVETPQLEPERPVTPTPEVTRPTTPAVQSSEQARMLQLVNEERQKAGVSPLILDTELSKVADVKAKDMVDNNYFSHDSPTYGSPFTMMKDFGIRYTAAGENLAGYNSVDKAHVGLMTSDGHRKNILNSNFTHIGIGVQKSPKYGYVFVQMFIRK